LTATTDHWLAGHQERCQLLQAVRSILALPHVMHRRNYCHHSEQRTSIVCKGSDAQRTSRSRESCTFAPTSITGTVCELHDELCTRNASFADLQPVTNMQKRIEARIVWPRHVRFHGTVPRSLHGRFTDAPHGISAKLGGQLSGRRCTCQSMLAECAMQSPSRPRSRYYGTEVDWKLSISWTDRHSSSQQLYSSTFPTRGPTS